MGILQRFSDIMRSNINALLDKCEDPAKMVDQMLLDLRKDLAEVKKETAAVMADEKNALRRVDDCRGEISSYEEAAKKAISAGNDDDAYLLITRKQQMESQLVSLQETYETASANADKMRQMHDKLVNDIESLESRKDAIKAKVATAKAQERMNRAMSGMDTSGTIAAFERMEAKADNMLDTANAEAELNEGIHSTSDLAARYASGGSDSVDAEIARMKAELGLEV